MNGTRLPFRISERDSLDMKETVSKTCEECDTF